MKIRNRDVDDILATVRQQLQDDKTLSVSLPTTIELLIVLAGRVRITINYRPNRHTTA